MGDASQHTSQNHQQENDWVIQVNILSWDVFNHMSDACQHTLENQQQDNGWVIQVNILSWKVFQAYHMGDVNSTYFRNSIQGHCTLRFRKKRSENVQLWTLVSPRIFIEKSWNFAQSCLNSSRIWGLFFSEEKLRKKWGKNPKTCWGCLRKSRLVSKKSSRKKNFFL